LKNCSEFRGMRRIKKVLGEFMFSNIFEESKTAILRYFPERQIYLRSGGEVSYFVLKTRTQLLVSIMAGLVSLWCIITVFNLIWGHNPLRGASKNNRLIKAEYERLLDDAEARYSNAQLQLTQQQETFEMAARSFQEKHAAIAQLVNQPVLDSALPLSGKDGYAKPKILRTPTVRDALPRESRVNAIQTASLEIGVGLDKPLTNLDSTQNDILIAAEADTLERIEKSRAIIEATDMKVEDVLNAGAFGTGGPLMNVAADGNNERVGTIKARAFEAKLLEDALDSLPLGYPIEVEHYRTSSFGVRKDPFTRRPAMHEAIDIASYHMAPILATADGTVIYSGNKAGYGKVVIIDHGHGFTTKYAHLAKTYVKRGQKIEKGFKVGGMGSTGRSTATHLHYEVRFHGNVYDPDKFLRAGLYVQ